MNTHSPSAIQAQHQVDRISRTGDSNRPESAESISISGDRKGDFSPTVMVGHGAAEARRPAPADCVGEVRHSHSDALREVEILHAGREIEQHMARYAETSNFADIGAAHAARHRMQMLIADRSPEQVARMEREQAERMAREPGATQ